MNLRDTLTRPTYTGRITVIDPALAGRRDQSDPYLREPVAVIDGQWGQSDHHPTAEAAEQWCRDLLQRADASGRRTARWAVIVSAGKAPVRTCPDRRACGPVDTPSPR